MGLGYNMVNVDTTASWPGSLQAHLWAGTGPAAAIKGQYRAGIFTKINWFKQNAPTDWAGVVGDTSVASPAQPAPNPGGGPFPNLPQPHPGGGFPFPGFAQPAPPNNFCLNWGVAAQRAGRFCRSCGQPL